eukprot:TRINITY_DN6585_c0_g1_i2.p1 TRINITY_DN6585_c0_g1~~TRINITY_DN6585_c0_g1_i2.p1  ORF type:complete len:385 (-),score=93.76 TRINITY_DN6585_c0_g1_i2:435-1589(-)
MVTWASCGRFPNAGFLCICVDSDALGTAREFSQLYFKSAPASLVNGFIDSRNDFPNFQAQLGCQGFVMFDGNCQLVVQASLSWMQYRAGAFRDVENKLLQLLDPPVDTNPANSTVGQLVKVTGLTSAGGMELNGQLGKVVGSSADGRWVVSLVNGGGDKSLHPDNLEDAGGAPVGKSVRIKGLTSEKGRALNGQVGVVLGSTEGGRIMVSIEGGSTIAFLPEDLEETVTKDADVDEIEADLLKGLPSVQHADMDEQHGGCIDALRSLVSQLSVKALRAAREEIAKHFEEEESLLRNAGFDAAASGDGEPQTADFSAFGNHVKDHKRIVAIADEALSSLAKACDIEGAVPKRVAAKFSRAFLEHAETYDALYVGKLASTSVYGVN